MTDKSAAEPKGTRVRYDRIREIENEMQKSWGEQPEVYQYQNAAENYYDMSMQEKNDSKYMATFPYPYMNGKLHLGHAFSMTKAEFQVRYQRQRGKRAIMPFGFHCTGMPIQAAANRLKREITSGEIKSKQPVKAEPKEEAKVADKPADKGGKKDGAKDKNAKKEKKPEEVSVPFTQFEILQQLGFSDEEIPKFQDANHWLEYFPPQGQSDLKDFGMSVDWRRSFITTSKNPYYDSFIQWQMNLLKELGRIYYGKKYTIYSALDRQPCADHDRSVGEGVGCQEYVGIKIKLLEFPESIKGYANKPVFLVAATLRPETMYGQTNCFVLPTATYGLYEMINGEYFIISERAAKNFAYQEMTNEFGKYVKLADVTGAELCGKALQAPLSHYEKVYALPMMSISMEKGTGIVTSVPSDSPDDWATLRDLQQKPAWREKFGIADEHVMPFEPVPIINIPDFGDLSAVFLVDELKIKSANDSVLLKQAKDKAYLKGFYEGKMLVGGAAGETVEKAKPIVKKELMDAKLAVPYYEPEGKIISKTQDVCIVACCYQWFLRYGEEEWRELVREHLNSDQFQAYNPKTQQEFDIIIDWLKEWGCTRTQGLGTVVPWDNQFVIESLSDSTIYMAYYTVAHFLQGGVLDGSKPGPLGIQAADMTPECWDYIFRKGTFSDACKVSKENLDKMRHEFEYWYPMDLRVSGKDLIRNHLTMCLYNHAAIWDKQMMPKSIYCNGYTVLNNQKMSKSTGNFITLRQSIERFGVDPTRLTLADAGDGLDDANFDTQVADAAILKLYVFEKWIQDNIKASIPEGKVDFKDHISNMDLWDNIVENVINLSITEATKNFDQMKYKQALKFGFFSMQSIKEDYLIAKNGKTNPYVLMRFLTVQLVLMNPIIPHFCQYVWTKYVYPVLQGSSNWPVEASELLVNQAWPAASAPFDKVLASRLKVLKDLKSNLRMTAEKAKGGKGGKKGKGKDAEPAKENDSCTIFVAKEYPEFQKQCLTILKNFEFNEENEIQGEYVKAIKEAFPDKKLGGLAMGFVSFQLKIAKDYGKDEALKLESAFDEQECIASNQVFLFEGMVAIKNIKVHVNTSDEAKAVAASEKQREEAKPSNPTIIFFSSS